MKRVFLKKALGIMLAGVLAVESGVPVMAAESNLDSIVTSECESGENEQETVEHEEEDEQETFYAEESKVENVEEEEKSSTDESSSTGESSSTDESSSTGESSSTDESSSTEIELKEIILNKSEIELFKGQEDTVFVTILPEDYNGDKSIKWENSNEEAVKIEVIKEDTVLIKAVGGGKAVVTASLNGKVASCSVNVIAEVTDFSVENENLNNNELNIYDNGTKQELKVKFEPLDATEKSISYVIKDEDILSCEVAEDRLILGTKGILGSTELTIKVGNITKVVKVNVIDEVNDGKSKIIPVDELKLKSGQSSTDSKSVVYLTIGSENAADMIADLGLGIAPSNTTDNNIKWESSDESVVSVSINEDAKSEKNGKWLNINKAVTVKAESIGTATITAKAENGVTASIKIVVKSANKGDEYVYFRNSSLYLYSNINLPENEKIKAKAKIEPIGAYTYSYCTSNKGVATVDANGEVTAKAPGTAVITVTAKENGSRGTVTVVVKNIAEAVDIPVERVTVIEGMTTEIPFLIAPKDISQACLNTLEVKSSDEDSVAVKLPAKKNSGVIKITAKKQTADSDVDAIVTLKIGDKIPKKQIVGDNIYTTYDEFSSVEKRIEIDVIPKTSLAKTVALSVNGKTDKKIKLKSGEGTATDISVKDTNGNLLDTTKRTVGYTSSDTDIVTVDKSGYIYAKKGGEATITAKVLDGSNISTTLTVTVEQKPEKIKFDREMYGLTKKANAAANVTLSPLFYPENTAASCKGVTWEIVDAGSDNEADNKELIKAKFKINKGKVTVDKSAGDGMYAIVKCKSNIVDNVECTIKVKVQSPRVSAVKFTKDTNEVVGIDSFELDFKTTYVKDYTGLPQYTAMSSDEEIVTVKDIKNGSLTIDTHKYGTATITLFADNAVKTACKVNVYPNAKGLMKAKSDKYYLQSNKNAPDDSVKISFVNSTTGKEILPSLLEYTSNSSDYIYIDDVGRVHTNPTNNVEIKDNKEIIITATLKDDPLKRKATTKVILCAKNQIDRLDVRFYADASDMTGEGISISDNDENASLYYSGKNQTIGLRVIPYDVDNKVLSDNVSMNINITDSSIAGFSGEMKKVKIGDVTGWNVKINVSKAGCFGVDISACVNPKESNRITKRTVVISSKSDEPIISSINLGKINKKAATDKIVKNGNEYDCITTEKTLNLYPADRTEIMEVDIPKDIVLMNEDGTYSSTTISSEMFFVKENGDYSYSVYLKAKDRKGNDNLKNLKNGKYEVTLRAYCKKFRAEDSENENSDKFQCDKKATFTIVNTMPSIANIKVAINPFIKGEEVKLPINTSEKIVSIDKVDGFALNNKFDIFKNDKDGYYYIKIKDNVFDNYNDKKMSGDLLIGLAGYSEKVKVNCAVTTTEKKPKITQKIIPGVQLLNGSEAYITLLDENKKMLENYTVSRKDNTKEAAFDLEVQNNNLLKIKFKNTYTLRNGAKYSDKILVQKPEWKKSVEITVSAKTFNKQTNPQISFEKSTVYINPEINENSASSAVISTISNIGMKEGNWRIADSRCAELFDVNYKDEIVTVTLKEGKKDDIKKKTTYNLVMQDVFSTSSDIKTKTLKVCVNPAVPTVDLKMSGNIDVINENTAINVKASISNTATTITKLQLGEGLDDFKCQRIDSTSVKIKKKTNASIKATSTSGYINVFLSNGAVIKKQIKFTPVQSTPKIETVLENTIDKAASLQTVDYDFNQCVSKGISISKIEGINTPNGFSVQNNNGHLFVTLANKTMKAGEYLIDVNVYFNGAQTTSDSVYGVPVKTQIKVIVK